MQIGWTTKGSFPMKYATKVCYVYNEFCDLVHISGGLNR